MKPWLWAVGFAAVLSLLADETKAAPAKLTPHRAVYDMSLISTKPGSGIVAASGTMTYTFDDVCDGWVVQAQVAMSYTYTEGGAVPSVTDFLSWESKSEKKREYRFRLRTTRDGVVEEDNEGTATLSGRGKDGQVTVQNPEEMTLDLPPETLFPTRHTLALLEAAQSKKRFLWSVIFDGQELSGAYPVNAVIGNPILNEKPPLDSPLLTGPHWPMWLAFYPVEGDDTTPEYEMVMDYYGNGVASEITQIFSNFSLRGRLRSIEALPGNGC